LADFLPMYVIIHQFVYRLRESQVVYQKHQSLAILFNIQQSEFFAESLTRFIYKARSDLCSRPNLLRRGGKEESKQAVGERTEQRVSALCMQRRKNARQDYSLSEMIQKKRDTSLSPLYFSFKTPTCCSPTLYFTF